MAYDEKLADRVRELVSHRFHGFSQKLITCGFK